MFGYIIPNQKELKVCQLDEYKAWYCGLCRILKTEYGLTGQLSLNYDMTFLGILLTSLYDSEIDDEIYHCVAHPFAGRKTYSSQYLRYAADMNLLLTYHKCLDDWHDERNLVKASYGAALHRKGKQIARKYPEKTKCIQECLESLGQAEKNHTENLDEAAGLFGKICQCLFIFREDEWKDLLGQMGFFLGKFIYLMDAWEDMEEDKKQKNYNPLFLLQQKMQAERLEEQSEADALFEQEVSRILTMMLAEACRAFEKLPIIENVEILRNILYSGVWSRYYRQKEIGKGNEDTGK